MDEAKKCNHETALKKLYSGAFVFTSIRVPIVEDARGCRKCSTKRKGKFCFVCGSKITKKLKVVTGHDYTEFRLERIGDQIYMEIRKNPNDFFGNRRKCNFSLNFFMKQRNWSYIHK